MESKHNNFIKITISVFIIIILLSCFTLLYSRYLATSNIKIKEYKITSDKITDNFHGLKIVHITDIHYGRITKKKELDELSKKINLTNPDIVVLTGDLIDKDTDLTSDMITELTDFLNSIEVKIGKYAIKGDHDANFDNWDIIIENSGFINLNDNYDKIYDNDSINNIFIAGISTNLKSDKKIEEKVSIINDYFNNTPEDNKSNYNILLIHESDYIDKFDYSKFDLILAGHSHNGQIRLPIIGAIIKTNGSKKYYDPYYKINNTDLYISSGIGVSDNNFRLFNRPSFNLYRLTNH